MRIRSTKPEFWSSKTIASVSWDARLVLKALESYVDDNGVGKDDLELIVTDTFRREAIREGSRVLARVSEAISELTKANLVTRYEADDEELLYIERWNKLQRVDKPQRGRFPRPDGSMDYTDEVDKAKYANLREESRTLAPVTGEQGNRGTEEQGNSGAGEQPAAAGDSAPEVLELIIDEPQGPSEDDLFKAFWDEYPSKAGRKPAREKFAIALRRASAEEIIAGAHRYNVDPNREQAYTKHAATWLHNDGWEDPPLPPRNTGKQTAADRKMQTARERHLRLTGQQDGAAPWTPRQIKEA